jgi:hypothetical protein
MIAKSPHLQFCHHCLENEYLQQAITICYGNILQTYPDTSFHVSGVLIRVLASVVYHSKWIKKFIDKRKKHPFSHIILLQYPDLLDELKKLVIRHPVCN